MAEPKEMDFFEHLDELRGRIIRCVIYVLVAMSVAWLFKGEIMRIVQTPLDQAVARASIPDEMVKVVGPSPMSGLMYAIQLALFGGLLFAFPLLALEAWLFIEPALYRHEKKYAYIVLPASITLFAGGVTLFYLISPIIFGFLLKFFVEFGMMAWMNIADYVKLLARLVLACGLVFQLPLVITFLARVGLVDHRMLLSKWRHAIVIILVASAIITPTPDPFTMSALAGPIIGLYMLSIGLAWIFGRPRAPRDPEDEMPEPEPDPESEPGNDYADTEAESEEHNTSATEPDDHAEPDDEML